MKDNVKTTMPRIMFFISIAMLMVAAFGDQLDAEYGYYTLLRLVVTATAVWSGVDFWLGGRRNVSLIFAFVALLFNPVIPVEFSKDIWGAIDVAVAGLFFITDMLTNASGVRERLASLFAFLKRHRLALAGVSIGLIFGVVALDDYLSDQQRARIAVAQAEDQIRAAKEQVARDEQFAKRFDREQKEQREEYERYRQDIGTAEKLAVQYPTALAGDIELAIKHSRVTGQPVPSPLLVGRHRAEYGVISVAPVEIEYESLSARYYAEQGEDEYQAWKAKRLPKQTREVGQNSRETIVQAVLRVRAEQEVQAEQPVDYPAWSFGPEREVGEDSLDEPLPEQCGEGVENLDGPVK